MLAELDAASAFAQYRAIIFNEANKDARLSTEGVAEALKQRDLIKYLGITHVVVSPMRRALNTALLAASFTDEPGTDPIKIVLMPCLRETVTYKNTVASSVAEITNFISEVIDENDLDASRLDIDMSQLSADDLWYLRQVGNEQLRDALVNVASQHKADSMEVFRAIKTYLLEHGSTEEGQQTNETDD